MFLRRTRRISTNGKLSNAATAAVEMLEGRVLLAYTLDPSFDGDGIVNGAGDGTIVVQPDSKVVARVNGDHAMRRFNVDGSIDTSFGGGTVTTPLTTSRMDLSGGKLIVAGYDSADQQSHLARYNLNGTLDTTFGGGDGLADVPTGIESLEIAPDGKLVVLGEHYVPNPNIPDSELPVFDIVRFNSDGSLDTSFSGDGSWEAQPGPAPFGGLLDGAVQSDGKIIAGAWDLYSPNEGREYWTFRVNADGTDDSTFHSFFGDTRSAPYAGISTIEALPDDRFLMGNAGRVERYLPDGTRDTTFATNTLGLEAADGYPTGWVNGLKPLADGKTLVAGLIDGNYGSPGKAFVARILADGNPDSSFSGNSRGMLVLAGAATTASSPHLDAQNRVIVGGTTSSSSGNTYWLARLADLPQTPYNGTPFKLNDTIQAEDFDRGGEGVAYHDSDSTNNGGAYRPADGVDIEPTSDTGGGYDVGWTMPGEWLEYSVDLGAGGSDLFAQLRLASPKSGGMMRFVIDAGTADAVEGEPFAVPNTGSFQNWQSQNVSFPTVAGGVHTVRLEFLSSPNTGGMANVNWFYISPRGSSGQTGTGLKGEYFNNMDFTAPVLTRTDPTVNFNWGTGSPDPRIDPDTFSVRWSGEIKFPATGTYTFYTTTDDGVRLTVNGQRIIDHLTPQAATMYSATIDIAGADSPRVPIVMEYFERSGGALAKLEWSGPGIVGRQVIPASQLYPVGDTSSDNQAPSAVPNFRVFTTSDHEIALAWDHATDNVGVDGYQLWIDNSAPVTLGPQIGTYTFSNLQAGSTHTFSIRAFDVARNFGPTSTVQATTTGGTTGEHGFHADYFNNMNFDFNGYAFSRTDATIDFNWGTGSPGASMDPDTFSVRWIGQLKAPTTGRYTFYTTTDDGVRLWVNGQLLIDHLTPQPATEWSGSIDLLAGGIYDIRMDYFERYGSAQAKLQWSGPGINKQVIPQSQVTTGSGSGDIQAPGPVPTFEAARITQNEIDVQWTPAFDDVGVAGYVLRQDDANPIVVGPDVRTFAYRNLQPSTPYRLTINAFDAAGNQGPRTTITVTTDAAQTSNGLTGTYFNNMDFTAPVFTRIDPKIDFNWAGNSPDADRIGPDTFSVRWTGYIVAPTTGRYTFYTTTDDGARLTINGQRIIDKLVPQAATEWSGSIDLVAGQKYSLNMEYFERFGMALARLQWAGPGISKQVVPQSNLSSS